MVPRNNKPGFDMRIIMAFAALAALAACEPGGLRMTETPVLNGPAAAGCAATAETVWEPGPAFVATAQVSGPDCANAVVLLTVRDANQAPAIVWASPVQHLFGLRDATTAAEMKPALTEFVRQTGMTTANLPEWDAGAAQPGGEFPFHPESWIDPAAYAGLRAQVAPVFAFPQGGESLAIYVLTDTGLEFAGVQQFPG